MGRTSCEIREAHSKTGYEVRQRKMNDRKWASRVLKYIYMKSFDTQWQKITKNVTAKYMKIQSQDGSVGPMRNKVNEAETRT